MVTFKAATWVAAGNDMNEAAGAFYREAHGVITSRLVSGASGSKLDAAAIAGDERCHGPWHRLIAAAQEALTADASRCIGTGNDYSAAEEAAAAERFW